MYLCHPSCVPGSLKLSLGVTELRTAHLSSDDVSVPDTPSASPSVVLPGSALWWAAHCWPCWWPWAGSRCCPTVHTPTLSKGN